GYSVDYGMLARAVAEYGRDGPEGTGAQQEGSGLDSCVAAEGPGAAYAAADEHGVVTNYTDDAAAADCRQIGRASCREGVTRHVTGVQTSALPIAGYSVDYGMLARAVAEYGRDGPEGTGAQQEGSGLDSCVAAEGPGAAYAAADEHGVVTNYTDDAAAADCR